MSFLISPLSLSVPVVDWLKNSMHRTHINDPRLVTDPNETNSAFSSTVLFTQEHFAGLCSVTDAALETHNILKFQRKFNSILTFAFAGQRARFLNSILVPERSIPTSACAPGVTSPYHKSSYSNKINFDHQREAD